MSELSSSSDTPGAELLNLPEDILLETAANISWSLPELIRYRDKMRLQNPELIKHAGAWVYMIRQYMAPRYGSHLAMCAESAFNTGNLMVYELLSRSGEKISQSVPDPKFMKDNIADTEPPVDEPQWLLDLSYRAVHLPRSHPALFNSAVDMFARRENEDRQAIRKSLFEPPVYNERSFDMAHFLSGAAEIILPVARYVQVKSLDRSL